LKAVAADESLEVQAATLALTAIATITAELALAEPGDSAGRPLAFAVGWVALALAARWWLVRRGRARMQAAATVALAAAFVAPLALAAGRAAWSGRPGPLELTLLSSLRNLSLGLAAASHHRSLAKLAAMASLFLILVSASTADGPFVVGAMGLYAIVGGAWLVLGHWRGLRLTHGDGESRRFPAIPLLGAFAFVGLAVAVAAAGPTRAAVALAGFFPSSGGTSWDDPDARGGVGDGDNEVKGAEKPESIGYADSDVYLDTDRPSLYDAFNDLYGEPSKPKRHERMIALSNQNIAEQRERPAENLQANRQFSAVRRGGARPTRGRPGDRDARALLYVLGRTPLHIGLAAYDLFDGRNWTEAAPPRIHRPLALERRGAPWFRVDRPDSRLFAGRVAHTIKIGGLDSSVLPAPAHVSAFRVGEVDRADYFGWAHDGMLKMEERTIPSSTVVETEAWVVDVDALASIDFPARPNRRDNPRLGPAASALRRSWVEGRTEGWSQVEAVVDGVRRHAAVDARAVAPSDCDDVVEHFVKAKRGPDYLFATAAAVMLRACGFSTRLVSGLYARPDRYDPRTRHTPIEREDVHVWVEVQLPDGSWVAVEPTPGYELMRPSTTWGDLSAVIMGVWERIAARPARVTLLATLAFAAVWFRGETSNSLATLIWRAGLHGPPRRVVLRTLALVERRARLGGISRPAGETLRRWYGPLAVAPDIGPDLDRLLTLAEWGLYAPEGAASPRWPGADVRDSCRRVVRGWTIGRFRLDARIRRRKGTSI
jgi:protein-glutamine gamma-glutamyltransferase